MLNYNDIPLGECVLYWEGRPYAIGYVVGVNADVKEGGQFITIEMITSRSYYDRPERTSHYSFSNNLDTLEFLEYTNLD